MLHKFVEFDYDIYELLNKNSKGMKFSEIVRSLNESAAEVYKSLKKLIDMNYVSMLDRDYAFYKITEQNIQIKIRKVKCNACGTIKRVHGDKQTRTACLNPDCKTPKGTHRYFEILNRDYLHRGIIKRINHVEEYD